MMTTNTDVQTLAAPSLSTLARTTALALAAAIVILVTIVLPAEYAIDPVGTGRLLGLTDIASPPLAPIETPNTEDAPLAPVQQGPIGAYPTEFKLDAYEVELGAFEYVEYKYHLQPGATMLYSWTASAPVIQDLHGEREGGGTSDGPAEESFDKEDRRQATGSYAAPFAGIHGWYWENPTGDPVKIRLTTSGFYGAAVEIRSDRTRHPRTLRTPDSLLPTDTAAEVANDR